MPKRILFSLAYCFFAFASAIAKPFDKPIDIVYSFDKPIDIVYLWVNGNDPVWQSIKEQYAFADEDSTITSDGNANLRYSDHDELKYSLRSIWKYAPFFNHIYIVTMNQRPDWLLDHPQITIVDHKEIFKHVENLPTFNSMAIESNLHRIPHLSEHFIYFNDDMFLGKVVSPNDFFSPDGKIKVVFEKNSFSPDGPLKENEIAFLSAWRNVNALLNRHYRRERRLFVAHAPYALSKSYIEKTELVFPNVFDKTATHQFRSRQDYAITNGFLQYHWWYQGLIEPSQLTNKMIHIFDDTKIKNSMYNLRKLEFKQPHTFCVQDNIKGEAQLTREQLHVFFENWYPIPAPWEKESLPFPIMNGTPEISF